MLPRTKMKSKSKGKMHVSLSALFGRRKEPSGQPADRASNMVMSAPPSVAAQGEPSEPTETSPNMSKVGNGVLNDDVQSMTTSTRCSIVGGESLDVNTNASSGFFNHAHHLILTNPMMVDNSTNIINHVAGDREAKAKELLSKHIIQGAAHDSSARDPPPQCHPGTRIEINKRIMGWFYDPNKRELILWIYGPAGVGKSAIVQTIAEALAIAKYLGASVFFSRPNGRNNSRSVFITIAYQLAVRIGAYSAFIGEKLASDPELVNKGMKEQFRTFFIEPFVEKKIGTDGKTLGILLDGLDELDEQRWQREIIRLVTTFALEHPNVPLVWIISSRPEPHISNTFKAKQIVSSYWEEHVPVNSPEGCQDVERYLRSSLETVREEFPHIVPQEWPEEMKIVKLAYAASGLFAFADVAIRFIEDPRHADPSTRLDDVLSIIDGSRVNSVDDQPFSHLDALYTRILASIPPKMWPVTQRVLGTIKWLSGNYSILGCTKGLSVLLGLELSKIYTAINDLYSILNISRDDVYIPLRFQHASFGDFLRRVSRSKEFYTSLDDIGEDVEKCGVGIWLDFRRKFPGGPSSEYLDMWSKYVSQFHSDVNRPADVLNEFNSSLFVLIHTLLFDLLSQKWDLVLLEEASPHHWDQFLELLCQMDAGTVCQGWSFKHHLVRFWFKIWRTHRERLLNAGIVYEIPLKQLPLDRLEWPKGYFTHNIVGLNLHQRNNYHSGQPPWRIDESSKSFDEYISGLEYFQQRNPILQVLICGTLGNRFAAFIYKYTEDDFKERLLHAGGIVDLKFDEYEYGGYYCVPCPDDV